MNQDPRVTVIVAVKNETDLLKRCLDSLFKQTYTNREIIVVNDGSGEPTRAILNSLTAPEIRVIHLESSSGQAAARNRALEIATGKYVAIADADDDYHPERLAQQVAYLEEHPDIDVLGTDFITENGDSWDVYHTDDEIRCQLLVNNPLVHSTVMFRRPQDGTVLRYDPEYNTAEDYELFVRHWEDWHFANLRSGLVTYRISSRGAEAHADQTQKARRIRESCLFKYFPSFPKDLLSRYHQFCELRAGLTAQDFDSLRVAMKSTGKTSEMRKLSKILYRQWGLYCLKNQAKPGLQSLIRMGFHYMDRPAICVRLLFKSL